MSPATGSQANPTSEGTDALATQSAVPLDEVMLAMDVVDTLRHQRALVEAELDGEQRERRLIARVQSVYESQGMEVPEGVIAEGVKALAEDRFTYDPPERGFAVRLAEIYVERGKWALRLLILVAIGCGVWASFAIPAYYERQSLIETFRDRVGEVLQDVDRLQSRSDMLARRKQALMPVDTDKTESEIQSDATQLLKRVDTTLESVRQALEPGPDPALYPDHPVRLDRVISTQTGALSHIEGDLQSVSDAIRSILELRSISRRCSAALGRLAGVPIEANQKAGFEAIARKVAGFVDRGEIESARAGIGRLEGSIEAFLENRRKQASLRARIDRLAVSMAGVDLAPDVKTEFERLVAATRQAFEAGDADRTRSSLARLEDLVAVLDLAYELRIVTRRGERSGVWRYQNSRGRSGPRNYYIVVEAIDPSGRRVPLPITNEENQRTSRVSKFAIRVPESVYESVKKDKLDNGIIDQRVFGEKKRGARKPVYRFEVAGGMITRW